MSNPINPNDPKDNIFLGQPWVEHWLTTPLTAGESQIAWIRSRPLCIKELMVQFPPLCLVKAKPEQLLMIPSPGSVGIIVSYVENGEVSVQDSPESAYRALCKTNWLEVVGYKTPMTPAWVLRVLKGECPDGRES